MYGETHCQPNPPSLPPSLSPPLAILANGINGYPTNRYFAVVGVSHRKPQSYSEGLRNVRLAKERTPELDAVTVALLSNRAAAHLALKNYGSCRRDCDDALLLSPGNVKCLYRKAKAELLLRRYRCSNFCS